MCENGDNIDLRPCLCGVRVRDTDVGWQGVGVCVPPPPPYAGVNVGKACAKIRGWVCVCGLGLCLRLCGRALVAGDEFWRSIVGVGHRDHCRPCFVVLSVGWTVTEGGRAGAGSSAGVSRATAASAHAWRAWWVREGTSV